MTEAPRFGTVRRPMASPRVNKKERHDALLHAARDVFASRGYHDAKVEDICSAANVAKGTYYLYFKDKRAVLEELVDGLFLRLGASIVRVDPDGDVRAQVEHNIRAIVAVFLADPALTKILLSYAAGLDPTFMRKIASFYDGARALLRGALIEGQRLGIVAPGNADFFASLTFGMLKETLFEVSTGASNRGREEIVHDLFAFLQHGYLRTVPTTAEPPASASDS